MTTDNERITGYIVPEVYNRFEQFCKENNLSCSRALNVIIAEYFGLEETLIFKQTWVGGVTLPEFEKLKQEVQELKESFNTLSNIKSIIPKNKELDEQINQEIEEKINQVLPEPIHEKTKEEEEIKKEINEEIKEKISNKVKEKINEVLSQPIKKEIKEEYQSDRQRINLVERIELNTTELAKRFNISRATINRHKKKFRENKITKEDYLEWTRSPQAQLR